MIVVDTHALIWLDQDSAELGAAARNLLDAALKESKLAVSAISFWETAMLHSKGRIRMGIQVSAWRKDLLSLGLVEIPLTGSIAIAAATLEGFHGDPADRIIAATALERGARLITADRQLLSWAGSIERTDARL